MPCRISGGHVLRIVAAVSLASAALPGTGLAEFYDADNMVLLAHRDDYSGYSDVWAFVGNNGREYVIQHTGAGTAWWDIDVPTNPQFLKFIPGPFSGWRDAFVIGDHAYIGTEGGGGIQVVDLTDPTDPTLVATYNATVGNSHTIFGDAARKLLFVMGGYADSANGGLQILDATDPVNLVEAGRWTAQYVHDGSVEGDVFHACLISVGRLRLLDVSNPADPVNLGTAYNDPTGAVHTSWPFGDGTHLAITEETNGGHLKIMNIANPSAITLVDSDNPAPALSAHNCHVQGNKLFVAWYSRGVRVYDISNPASVSEVGWFDTFPQSGSLYSGNWGVYPHLPSGVIAASDISNGLFLMEYDANAGRIEGAISSSGGGFITGATVEYVNYGLDLTTDATGAYRFHVHPGAGHQVSASAYGHVPATTTVSVAPNGATVANFVLTRLPNGGLTGRVTDLASGLPIPGADVSLVGTPHLMQTDANGNYSFAGVPTVPTPNFLLHVERHGYAVPADFPVTIAPNELRTRDVQLRAAAHYEDFASPTGWAISNDPSATSGFWQFGEPQGTYQSGVMVQPELDHTLDPENQAAVTGNTPGGIGENDVDGGATRLLTPVFDLSAMTLPHAFYYRWYAVNDEVDQWQVHVSQDGGASWILIDHTATNEALWTPVDVDLSSILTSFAQVRFRFTAEDPNPGQIVEAALDDFTLYDRAGGATGVAVLGPTSGLRLELAQNFPNPFARSTAIDFTLPKKSAVRLFVFDVRGARVATIVDEELEAGRHRADWDGLNFARRPAAAGVYFYELQTDEEIRTRKMVRVD